MKKAITPILLIGVLALALGIIKKLHTNDAEYTIGILQTASHPALDQARDGFVKALQEKLGSNVAFVIQNAQGSVDQAYSIAQSFHSNSAIRAIYAIATPAAQAIAAVEKEKPIIIAAVSDVSSLGSASNMCGITDMIDIEKEIALLPLLLPRAKTIALLYSTAEINSIAQIQAIKKELSRYSLSFIEIGIAQENDIPAAVLSACRKADALLCPTDNALALAMDHVAAVALKYNKPLIACHNQAVMQGALVARGVNYDLCGHQAALLAYAILINNESPKECGICSARTDTIYINQKTLHALNITVPSSLQSSVTLL